MMAMTTAPRPTRKVLLRTVDESFIVIVAIECYLILEFCGKRGVDIIIRERIGTGWGRICVENKDQKYS